MSKSLVETYQGFRIIDLRGPVGAAAQFLFNGYEISMSTIGVPQGGCPNEVHVYLNDALVAKVFDVESAINWVIRNPR